MALPIMAVLAFFLVLPIIMIVIVSFWQATEFSIIPAFDFENYEFLFGSNVTYRVFFNTFKYAFITWVFTLSIGFTVAYFLAFHVRTLTWQIVLFLLCTIPFWTSNIIRMIMISWGVIDEPLDWLLFSDFAVILAFVHLYTLFMVVPIFNTFKYALITWACTLLIGFTVAYYLAFHIRSLTWQIALFLLCTIPFWTSNIIRMITS